MITDSGIHVKIQISAFKYMLENAEIGQLGKNISLKFYVPIKQIICRDPDLTCYIIGLNM